MEYRVSPNGNLYTFLELKHALANKQLLDITCPEIIQRIWESYQKVEVETEPERKILREKYKFIYEKELSDPYAAMAKDIEDILIWGNLSNLKHL